MSVASCVWWRSNVFINMTDFLPLYVTPHVRLCDTEEVVRTPVIPLGR